MSEPVMKTRVYGKWILAGEHAVLRGNPAVVFPVFSRSLELSYFDDDKPLTADFSGEAGAEMLLLFWGVMEKGLEMIGHIRTEVLGRFRIVNDIPIGAGLGASAALCVAIGRWFVWKGWIPEGELYEFSRQLENMFHGESSGVDIAVAISAQGLHFERSGTRYSLEPMWQPRWYLSYSGKRGVTSECVAKVKHLWEENEAAARLIDKDMKEAVMMAEEALRLDSAEKGFELLINSVNKARSCFERWGLAGGEMGQHMTHLMSQGAVAVKPTGSGDGGFVLSLWQTPPPSGLRSQLIYLGRD